MKRLMSLLMCLCLLVCLIPCTAYAVDTSRSYDFQLTVDDKQEVTASPDQIVTLSLVLKRTDSSEPAEMYAMQAEFEYDDTFFELVESSIMTASGVEHTDMARRTGGRAFYLNFLSLSGGAEWMPEVLVGTFQFKVIGASGVSTIKATNCLVSTQDGSTSYESVCNDVRVIVSTDCLVTFVENGGTEVEDQHVQYGDKVKEPEDPSREGYSFNGWYSDLDRTKLWNFDTDTVTGNLTLYAGWLEGGDVIDAPGSTDGDGFPWWIVLLVGLLLLALLLILLLVFGKKKVTFDTDGGTELDPVYVKKGETLERPMTPVKPGAMFVGWYKDPDYRLPWDFKRNRVRKSMTLYARWK